HESPAIRTLGRESLSMAGRSIEEIAHFDHYSCFPSAVEIARDELGIPEGDPRPLTVTGGLPYHGGAGTNYVMNAIVTMVQKLRATPGDLGMVTANGGYLTKHAAGIYSTAPSPPHDGAGWARRDPAEYQAEIDTLVHPPVILEAEGDAAIETYTVAYGRTGEPEAGILIGRMGDINDLSAPRFVANTPADPDLLAAMTREDFVGCRGRVANTGKRNILTL
ncbi:MAG: acetyl-CoA acetyltransferase, partial [Parvibaculum sp.]